MAQVPTIPQFFAGRSVLVTGANGFMGKVLVEKLLYSCPDVDTIYVMIRPKKGKIPATRLQEMMESPCFGRLNAAAKAKVVAVAGDVSELGLGLSDDDRLLLQERVSIVFHNAASVRFNDPLKKATLMNTRGTREMLELAKGMKHLQVFQHLSTAYCNTDQGPIIDEVIYPTTANWWTTIKLAETFDENTLNILTHKYMGNLPNTYTFTKRLAEACVNDYSQQIPVVIIRPSIVVTAFVEPFPGWLDHFNGPLTYMIGQAKGILRVVLMKKNVCPDYIPVDTVIRCMVGAAWLKGTLKRDVKEAEIMHLSGTPFESFSCDDMLRMAKKVNEEFPVKDTIWKPSLVITDSWAIFYALSMLLQVLPALILDKLMVLRGVPPRLMKIQRLLYSACHALAYFTLHEWVFRMDSTLKSRDLLLPEDHEAFYAKPLHLGLHTYTQIFHTGYMKYLLMEKEEDLPKARKHLERLYLLDRILKGLLVVFLLWSAVYFHWIDKIICTTSEVTSYVVSGLSSLAE